MTSYATLNVAERLFREIDEFLCHQDGVSTSSDVERGLEWFASSKRSTLPWHAMALEYPSGRDHPRGLGASLAVAGSAREGNGRIDGPYGDPRRNPHFGARSQRNHVLLSPRARRLCACPRLASISMRAADGG